MNCGFPSFVRNASITAVSIPWSATFMSNGETVPPCGVTLLGFPRLWYPYSAHWWRDIFPVLGVNLVRHDRTLRWFHGFYTVDPCGFLALVVLRDPTNCQEPG